LGRCRHGRSGLLSGLLAAGQAAARSSGPAGRRAGSCDLHADESSDCGVGVAFMLDPPGGRACAPDHRRRHPIAPAAVSIGSIAIRGRVRSVCA